MTDSSGLNPPTELIDAVRAVWANVLDLDVISVPADASFLSLGGDSVLTVRMAALVRQRLGAALALADVRVEHSAAQLATLIHERGTATGALRPLPLELARRDDPEAPFPLLPLQQGYFVGQQDGWELSYRSAHHYVDIGLEDIEVDEIAEALQDALERLAEHQAVLRARILPDGRQRILPLDDPEAVPVLRVTDLSAAGADEIAETLATIRHEMSIDGPDPTQGCGLDMRLTLLPGAKARLHSSTSLMIIDGWSSGVFYRDLFALVSDQNAMLAPMDVDFGDYAVTLDGLSGTDQWQADRDWWWDRLDDLPLPPALPLAADPAAVRPILMGARQAVLDADRWATLRGHCAQHGVTPSAAMFAVFSTALARACGHRRFLLNTLQLNRLPLHPDVPRLVGAFSSTMLVPVELPESAAFSDLAIHAQRDIGEAMAHNLVTGVEVSRELGRRRNTRRPVAPVVFQSTLGVDAALGSEVPRTAGPLGSIDLASHYQQLRTPQVALEVRLFELRDELVVVFSLVEELFEASDVDRMFGDVMAMIESLVDAEAWSVPVALPGPLDAPEQVRSRTRLSVPTAPTATADEPGPPRDDLERTIVRHWTALLGCGVPDRAADFFGLGGDSLLAVRMLGALAREEVGRVTPRRFLERPSVAGLASAVRETAETAAHGDNVGIGS
ncbi:condensation domain-containing protein [Micromonospora inyonensis]|uniref:Phosphopantetheine attachment site n=1 Tax=Micromonospora inyonensis TaxID=47866 RepID=A0A1C6RDX6_9ACTN|nr:condensation domain-containing protein [Micromonospora inyonensis]SCL15352.1 Phosphopantetheine attachment site [Micromonospora inyonensis]